MKTKLSYCLAFLLFISCRTNIVTQEKIRKIAVHTFTGKGEHEEATTWFYIKDVADRGFSGYYFKSSSKPNDFKDAHFIYSKNRPLEFEGQYASGEKVEFLDPSDLHGDIQNHLSDLESLYQKK